MIGDVCLMGMLITMLTTPIFLVIWLVKKFRKEETRKAKLRTIVSAALFLVCLVVGIPTIHNHEYKMVEVEEATCEEAGYELYRCSECGYEKKEKIEKLGHDMVETQRVDPTEDSYGEVVRECSRCGEKETEVLKKLEKEVAEEKTPEAANPVEEPDESDVDTSVTYEEIYRAYKENELLADDLYQYNRYRITAAINGMSTGGLFNLTGGATLTMEKRVGNTRVFFYAEFEKDQEEALKTIKVGDTITFEGECISAGTWSDCELITE